MAVDAAGDTGIADIRMDGIGEVDRRGAGGQLKDLALGRKHIDLVGEQVDLHVLDEFQRVIGPLPHFHQARAPSGLPASGWPR